MPGDVLDGYARLSPADRVRKAGDIFQEEFRRQLKAMPHEQAQATYDVWSEMSYEQRGAMLEVIAASLGLELDNPAEALADHAGPVTARLLETLLDASTKEKEHA